LIYDNLPYLVKKDLKKLTLCPPVSISSASDPCQDIPELRVEVGKLVQLLMNYGISFFITTKGDPSFLLRLPGFISYEPKFAAITVEGTSDVLKLLSPLAPPFESRVEAVHKLCQLGIPTLIRFDPVFIHLFKPIEGCTANCHVSCKDLLLPPCGQPKLAAHEPFKISYLRGQIPLPGF
jgi:DNA repair photolyase